MTPHRGVVAAEREVPLEVRPCGRGVAEVLEEEQPDGAVRARRIRIAADRLGEEDLRAGRVAALTTHDAEVQVRVRELGIEALTSFTTKRHVHWNLELVSKPWWFREE